MDTKFVVVLIEEYQVARKFPADVDFVHQEQVFYRRVKGCHGIATKHALRSSTAYAFTEPRKDPTANREFNGSSTWVSTASFASKGWMEVPE